MGNARYMGLLSKNAPENHILKAYTWYPIRQNTGLIGQGMYYAYVLTAVPSFNMVRSNRVILKSKSYNFVPFAKDVKGDSALLISLCDEAVMMQFTEKYLVDLQEMAKASLDGTI